MANGRKRTNVTIRMRDAMKSELASAAGANGRSLSEEIEWRLEFHETALLTADLCELVERLEDASK